MRTIDNIKNEQHLEEFDFISNELQQEFINVINSLDEVIIID